MTNQELATAVIAVDYSNTAHKCLVLGLVLANPDEWRRGLCERSIADLATSILPAPSWRDNQLTDAWTWSSGARTPTVN